MRSKKPLRALLAPDVEGKVFEFLRKDGGKLKRSTIGAYLRLQHYREYDALGGVLQQMRKQGLVACSANGGWKALKAFEKEVALAVAESAC